MDPMDHQAVATIPTEPHWVLMDRADHTVLVARVVPKDRMDLPGVQDHWVQWAPAAEPWIPMAHTDRAAAHSVHEDPWDHAGACSVLTDQAVPQVPTAPAAVRMVRMVRRVPAAVRILPTVPVDQVVRAVARTAPWDLMVPRAVW